MSVAKNLPYVIISDLDVSCSCSGVSKSKGSACPLCVRWRRDDRIGETMRRAQGAAHHVSCALIACSKVLRWQGLPFQLHSRVLPLPPTRLPSATINATQPHRESGWPTATSDDPSPRSVRSVRGCRCLAPTECPLGRPAGLDNTFPRRIHRRRPEAGSTTV